MRFVFEMQSIYTLLFPACAAFLCGQNGMPSREDIRSEIEKIKEDEERYVSKIKS